ncbi:hypothetical protein L1887_33427 [Cichorium endivia]|nr:hypothetical protein L1887_33427 [Cichorium endivia]
MVLRHIFSVAFVILLLSLASPLMGISARRIRRPDNGDDDQRGLSSMLPRGIVPPSGPSPCHNMLYHKPTRFAPPPPPFDPPTPSAPPYTPPPFTPPFPFMFDPPPPPADEIICP